MSELRDLLDGRASRVEPGVDPFAGVMSAVRHRRRRRIAVTSGAGVMALIVLAGIVDVRRSPVTGQASWQLAGSAQSREVRTHLGIVGLTKDASDAVVVSNASAQGGSVVTLVHVATGVTKELAVPAKATSISPDGDVVVAVTDQQDVVVVNTADGTQTTVGSSGSPAQSPSGQAGPPVSWDSEGAALFAYVEDRWVRISNPGRGGLERSRTLAVPSIPGGPILLSVSPSGDQALLFGLVTTAHGTLEPRLYLGAFDGSAVTSLQPIAVPSGALDGPLGWVGDNAFLLQPAPGRALVVRTDGTSVLVRARGIPNPCRGQEACAATGPDLLGTNGDGSLLFWKISATRTPEASAAAVLILYYRTWLDGTHTVRLTGPAGRFGPPVAPR